MSIPISLLLSLILISSILCGIVIVICSILVCKYWYKYRRNRHSIQIDTTCYDEEEVFEKDKILLKVTPAPVRRSSDNAPYSELPDPVHRNRSISQTTAPQLKTIHTNRNLNDCNAIEKYRKNSYHLRPFDLAPHMRGKISHSMEFISRNKTSSYERIDERKVRSFDSDLIRMNSKSLNIININKGPSKELSKSLLSFLQKLSKLKTKIPEDKKASVYNILKISNKSNQNEVLNDLDSAYNCPFQISKNIQDCLQKKGSLESSLCISSFDSSEMNEAFLAVSREIHNSCDSDLCFKSATVKRKQFYRENRKRIYSHIDHGKSTTQNLHCSSANQSIERDYSIDEKSSAIFKEFLRNDPNFDKFVMEENVRQRLRNKRGLSHHNSQHRRRSRVIDTFKSASFTDGDPHPQTNNHTNSYESQSDNTNRSPSPLPTIVLSCANQF